MKLFDIKRVKWNLNQNRYTYHCDCSKNTWYVGNECKWCDGSNKIKKHKKTLIECIIWGIENVTIRKFLLKFLTKNHYYGN